MSLLDTGATVMLAPLLLVQAWQLRKRALRLPEAAGPRHGITGSGPPLRLLIIGDSSAAGVGAATQACALAGQLALALGTAREVHWHLIAATGATTTDTLARISAGPLPPADAVLLVLGVNDVTRGGPRRIWRRTHAKLRALLRARSGARALYITAIPPLGAFPLLPDPLRWLLGRRATRFDATLRADTQAEGGTTYIPFPDALDPADMAQDGFHPGPRIYAAWAHEIARRILSGGP